MARLDLTENQKFKRLAHRLAPFAGGMGKPLARGLLETLWNVVYERADDYLGDADLVEADAGWLGEPGALADLLAFKPEGKRAGFICRANCECHGGTLADRSRDIRTGYFVHELWSWAPAFVKAKAERRARLEEQGKTIADVRRAAGAGTQFGTGKSITHGTANGKHLPTQEAANSRNGTGRDGTGREKHPPENSGGGPQGVMPGMEGDGSPVPPADGSTRRGRPPGSKRPLPFSIADAMKAVEHGVLVEPFPKEPKFTSNLTRLIRAYPDLSTWRRIADWLAGGGDGWGDGKRGKPDLGIFIARFGGWMQASAQDGGGELQHDSPPGDERPPFLDDPEELKAMLTDEERAKIDAHVKNLRAHA